MSKTVEEIASAIGAGIVIALLIYAGHHFGRRSVRNEAVKLGHAQYNPTNANFEWKAVK